jgi:peptide methionine sulfoxide reductase msrA/msrB
MAKNNSNLSDLQNYVIFQNGTEKAFDNEYWNNDKEGIYVDIIDDQALFSSKDKFDSGTGWPSFTSPIDKGVINEKSDNSYGMSRVEVRAKNSNIHLGHVFNDRPNDKSGMRYCINSASLRFIPKEAMKREGYEKYLEDFKDKDSIRYEKAVIAGGCFWGMEELFSELDGVVDVITGYTGGNTINPTYEVISTGKSNHAEAIEITFDSKQTSYDKVLRFFFKIHDPTTLNRQGNDVGTQYRSAIFYLNEKQKKIAEELINSANQSGVLPGKIVTTLEKFDKFYKAEKYHQKHLKKNPMVYTCHRVREEWMF